MDDNVQSKVAVLDERLAATNRRLDELFGLIDRHLVTRQELLPIRLIVYGGTAVVLVAVATAVVAVVLVKP